MGSKKAKTATVTVTGARSNEDLLSDTYSDDGALAAAIQQVQRLSVAKAYKMFVGGAFVRSESGRYFQVTGRRDGADPDTVNIPRGSRKDVRDAILVAKNAEASWAGKTAFNRGQILYRLAEVMESRKQELVLSLTRSDLVPDPALEVDRAIDRSVYYAGFCDKIHSLVASHNPVAGPHFGFTIPEPMGVVGVVAPERPALLGLVSTVLPVVTGGNTVVAVASPLDPRTAILFCECVATSDMPGGVINVLTGHVKELAPVMAKHREMIAMDVWTADADLRASVERDGADNVKRVKVHEPLTAPGWQDEQTGQGIGWVERFLEAKTVWHPVGV
jgi:acyl-CoA reductase-like NAD-dependent aldehyde dehydrogenase